MIVQGVTLTGTTVVDASIPTTNMLLYLDAGNSTSYPGTGTTWYDISGNTNNTTGTSGATYNSGSGGYFNFNGSGYFTTNSAKYNTTYTGKSMFFAANLAAGMSSGTFRNIFGSNGSNRNFNLYMYYTGSVYQLHYSAGGLGGFSNNLTYTPGNWFTCGVTQTTGGLVTYYFNGQAAGTNNFTFNQYLSTTSENVGASDNYWYGPISVVGIYKTALSSTDMLTCHNAVRTRYGLL